VVSDRPLRQRLIANAYETARARTLEAQAAKMMTVVAERLGIALPVRSVRLQADQS